MGEDEKNTRGNVLAFDKSYRKLYSFVNKRCKTEQKNRLHIYATCSFVRASRRFLSNWTKSREKSHYLWNFNNLILLIIVQNKHNYRVRDCRLMENVYNLFCMKSIKKKSWCDKHQPYTEFSIHTFRQW